MEKEDIIKEAIEKLEALEKSDDTEMNHLEADDVLCDVLTQLGYKELVDLYKKVNKWYA